MSSQEQPSNLPNTAVLDPAVEHKTITNGEKEVNSPRPEGKPSSSPVMGSESCVDPMAAQTKIPPPTGAVMEDHEITRMEKTEESPDAMVEMQMQSLKLSSELQMSVSKPPSTNEALEDTRLDGLHPREPKPEEYLDPTPTTPRVGNSPSLAPHTEQKVAGEVNPESEIQSIMEQFGNRDDTLEEENPWADTKMQLSAPIEHPPRQSSLIPVEAGKPLADQDEETERHSVTSGPQKDRDEDLLTPMKEAHKPNRVSSLPQAARISAIQDIVPPSPGSPMSLSKVLPPAPDPEPDLPFDFHRFLDQLREKSADPVAKYLRSFLIEFARKQWMVHEQVKLINDFLAFITNKMARCAIWRDVSDAEFDNAKEGMEKLVMNRLYYQTFSPAIPPPTPAPTPKGKRKPSEKILEPGRRGQHQEDIERDEILGQKVKIYGWIQEEHLDIPRVSENGRRFLVLAQQELLKIKNYRAPRDKIICVLNCCKVIFGILRNSKSSDTSADSFVPLLIYVVLHANPDHLVSNVQYILRFRNQDKLGGEAGYYLSSLMGAIQFIESLDRTSLTVSDDDFEKNVEAAVSAIAEKHQEELPLAVPPRPQPLWAPTAGHLLEKSGPSLPEVIPRNSIDAEYSSPRKSPTLRGNPGETGDGTLEENTAVSGLLRTIQKPLSSIGRMFSDDPGAGIPSTSKPHDRQAPQPRLSPAVFQPPRHSEDMDSQAERPQNIQLGQRAPILPPKSKSKPNEARAGKLSAEDAAARQASAEAAEAQRIQRVEHQNVVETLAGMFPDLEKDIIDDVVRQKQGRVGLAVDACLALNN